MKKKTLSLLLAVVLVLSLVPGFAAEALGGEHISVKADAPAERTITVGQLCTVMMSDIFEDGQGHDLSYSLGADYGTQTYIKDGQLVFNASKPDKYIVTINASCSGGDKASHTIEITANPASEGAEIQYGYDETPASEVTIFVTLSNDGIPLRGNDEDETVLSHLELTIPYFDLALYGLESFYRYQTDNGRGEYINETLVERPTGLHMYIYLLERFYMGLPEEECGKGTSGVLDYGEAMDIYDMEGELAYNSGSRKAINMTGSATSLYMDNFWGHDENLLYYRNHVYPLMSAGWGATSDYMLLSDGDTMDIAMFTNWNFYHSGAFLKFDEDSYEINAGETLNFTSYKYETKSVDSGGAESFLPVEGMNVYVYDEDWNLIQPVDGTGSDYEYTFEESGTFYLAAFDPNIKSEDACMAPATSKVVVSSGPKGDLNGDGEITGEDADMLYGALSGENSISEEALAEADLNGDGRVDILDIMLIYVCVNNGNMAY